MSDHLIVVAIGIVAVAVLESIALLKGVDGVMFGSAVGAIAAIAGYMFKGHMVSRRGRDKAK